MRLANGRVLQWIGVDTDADVSPRGLKRLRAVGSFQSQLAKAAPRLGVASDMVIRVLLIAPLLGPAWRAPLDRSGNPLGSGAVPSRPQNTARTDRAHTQPLIQPFATGVPGAQPVWEGRCGTSAQIDQVSYASRTSWGPFQSAPGRRTPYWFTVCVTRTARHAGTLRRLRRHKYERFCHTRSRRAEQIPPVTNRGACLFLGRPAGQQGARTLSSWRLHRHDKSLSLNLIRTQSDRPVSRVSGRCPGKK